MQVQINKWGNSIGFRIPRGIADTMDIRIGDVMEVETADGALLLKKAERPQKKYKLADILDSFTPASAHPEVDWGAAQGRELW